MPATPYAYTPVDGQYGRHSDTSWPELFNQQQTNTEATAVTATTATFHPGVSQPAMSVSDELAAIREQKDLRRRLKTRQRRQ